MTFTAFTVENHKIITVDCGGLPNGNDYAEIDIKYKEVEGEEWFENIIVVFYKEYGNNPIIRFIGDDIEFDGIDAFRILHNGKYVDEFGNEEEEED